MSILISHLLPLRNSKRNILNETLDTENSIKKSPELKKEQPPNNKMLLWADSFSVRDRFIQLTGKHPHRQMFTAQIRILRSVTDAEHEKTVPEKQSDR